MICFLQIESIAGLIGCLEQKNVPSMLVHLLASQLFHYLSIVLLSVHISIPTFTFYPLSSKCLYLFLILLKLHFILYALFTLLFELQILKYIQPFCLLSLVVANSRLHAHANYETTGKLQFTLTSL